MADTTRRCSARRIARFGQKTDVVLITMPFASLCYPSLALSVLKPSLAQLGIRAEVCYLTFPFAELSGADLYTQICANSV